MAWHFPSSSTFNIDAKVKRDQHTQCRLPLAKRPEYLRCRRQLVLRYVDGCGDVAEAAAVRLPGVRGAGGLGPAGDGVDLLRLADDVPLEPAQVGREGERGGAADPRLGVVLALPRQLLAGPRPRVQPPSR